jgi:beta-glucosidase
VNPSGRLPVTFPTTEAQLPNVKIQGDPNGAPHGPIGRGGHYGTIFTASYPEGAAVGYKWFAEHRERPLFPFGFGLSYTAFRLLDLSIGVSGNETTASLTVRNAGDRAGIATPQVYVSGPLTTNLPLRLVGWTRIALRPGEEKRATVTIDRRLLAHFDEVKGSWRVAAGVYEFMAAFCAEHPEQETSTRIDNLSLTP